MPVQWQNVAVPFTQGLKSKADPKQVPLGGLLELENAVFTKPGELGKRYGYRALPAAITSAGSVTGSISAGQALATYSNELLLCDASALYSYDASGAAWQEKGPFNAVTVTQTPVIRNTATQTQQDGTTHPSGLQVYAWEDSTGGVRYCVMDSDTGQTIVPSTLLDVHGIKPRVLSIDNVVLIVYLNVSDNRLYAAVLPVISPTSTPIKTPLTSTQGDFTQINSSAPNYDAAVISVPSLGAARWVLAFNNQAGGTTLRTYLQGAVTSVVYTTQITSQASNALTVFGAVDGTVILAYWTGALVRYVGLDPTLQVTIGSGTAESISDVISIAGVGTGAGGNFRLFYTVKAGATHTYDAETRTATVADYTASAPATYVRSVALAGKPFIYGSTVYQPLAYESPLQPTYFVADQSGSIVAKLLYQVGGGIPARGDGFGAAMLPGSTAIDSKTWRLSLLTKDFLSTNGGVVYEQTGVVTATLDFFSPDSGYPRAELGRNLQLGGGFVSMYDGVTLAELGFHLYPEASFIGAGTGGVLSAGQYQYTAIYIWTDNQGQTHRSAPSIPVTYQASAGATVTISVPKLRLTGKQSYSAVSVEFYRTTADGTVFYRLASVSNTSGFSQNLVQYVDDSTSDDDIIGNPQIYTTGGVVENIPPGPISSMAVHRNRLFALDAAEPLVIWYSKIVQPGAPVEFSDLFTLNVDPRGGPVTALASLDDKLIIFKESSIFMVTGQGPDDTGGQNDFSDPILVTTDVGCMNARSIVTVPAGLMFQSSKGIYLLDRGLAVSYVGADVERYNGERVTSAQLISSTNQVRLTLAASTNLPQGAALVFDYFAGQWSVFKPLNAVDSVLWQGLLTYLQPNGQVRQETPGVWSDAGEPIKLRVTTSWIQRAGLQGFERVRECLILGRYASPHSLQVSVAWNFDETPRQIDTITPQTPGSWGSDSTWGGNANVSSDSTTWGGTYQLYCWRLFFQTQKCTAVRLTIEDVQSTAGEGMALSGLTVRYGVKAGGFKRPASQSIG